MFAYFIIFLVPFFLFINSIHFKNNLLPINYLHDNKWNLQLKLLFILYVLIIGFRFEVGGDWETYLFEIEIIKNGDDTSALFYMAKDPVYIILNNIAIYTDTGVYLVNIITAIIFTYGLFEFCLFQKRPLLSIIVAVPYLITVVSMGYTRQSGAIGVVMLALVAILQNKNLKFFILIIVASLFHKSAVILIFLIILSKSKRIYFNIIGFLLISILLYIFIIQDSLDALINGYIINEYQSSGTLMRILLNILPASIFLLYSKKFILRESEIKFWKWMSFTSFIFIYFFNVSPSSTAVDRVALYWIPIQLFVLSNIPDIFKNNNIQMKISCYLVILYSAILHFGWLLFSDTSFKWIPYKFYPLELFLNIF
jgi:hypothetical protein